MSKITKRALDVDLTSSKKKKKSKKQHSHDFDSESTSDSVKNDISDTVPDKQVNQIDIKLTDVLGIEHAITNLQNSVKKIIEDAPDFDALIKFMETADMEDTLKKEVFIALSRTNNVKAASKLKSLYDSGKLPLFDYILNVNENENIELFDSAIELTGGSNLDTLTQESKAKYQEKPYPPALPKIKNPVILSRVFMHKSVVNDKIYLSSKQILDSHNERLEFLGDSILNNIMTLIIFEMFPDSNEGELSKLRIELVNNQTLTNWSKLYDFDKELRRNISDAAFNSGKMKIYADVFEAYIGGLFTDNVNLTIIRNWLQELAEPLLNNYRIKRDEAHEKPLNKNAKAELYSLIGCAAMAPRYEIIQSGDGTVVPFIVLCMIKDEELGRGKGQNIKEAGLRAAMAALEDKEAIERYSLIRRQMPRSVSVMKGDKSQDSESDDGDSNVVDATVKPALALPLPASLPSLPRVVSDTYLELPITPPPIAEHLIDMNSKGRLYVLLRKQKIQPEYDSHKLRDGTVKVVLTIKNIPFVSCTYKSGKLAGQRAAQYLLENVQLLKDNGLVD